MANQIRIRTSVEIVNDNSVANEGTAAGDYTIQEHGVGVMI